MSGEVETSQAELDLTALVGFLVGNQDLERLVIRYTGCSLYGRREFVGDVYFGSADRAPDSPRRKR